MRLIFILGVLLFLSSGLLGQETNADSIKKQSLFNYLLHQKERPQIKIVTDAKHLLRTSAKKEYQPASITIETADREEPIFLQGEIKARGKMRKKVCRIPPVKLNFGKGDLDSLGFLKLDKLKFVFPCNDNNLNQEKLYKEFFLYGLYDLIDENGMQAFLVDVIMEYEGEEKFNFVAFVIEEEDHYCDRKDAQIIGAGKLTAGGLDRKSFVKMEFFQYMIANTDWSIRNRHNLEMVKLSSMAKAIAIPYDFDFAGFVGQDYAVPHESLPIKSVHDRYFFSYPLTDKEFYMGVNYFKSLEDEIMEYCDNVTYLDDKLKKEVKNYLEPFFEEIKKPKQLRFYTKRN